MPAYGGPDPIAGNHGDVDYLLKAKELWSSLFSILRGETGFFFFAQS